MYSLVDCVLVILTLGEVALVGSGVGVGSCVEASTGSSIGARDGSGVGVSVGIEIGPGVVGGVGSSSRKAVMRLKKGANLKSGSIFFVTYWWHWRHGDGCSMA